MMPTSSEKNKRLPIALNTFHHSWIKICIFLFVCLPFYYLFFLTKQKPELNAKQLILAINHVYHGQAALTPLDSFLINMQTH